ncbi:MAG: SPOR domain-containing protein, partial [Gammaproteobacteria bacterium]
PAGPEASTPAPLPEPAPTEASPTPEPAAPSPPPPAVPAGGRYLVQVASFSSTGNAERLSARLREQGLAVLNDTVQSDAGVLHRVRLGPYGTEEEADRVVRELTRQMSDLRQRVLDLRPDQAAPATASPDPLVRWVVQVGSFSERENADQLVFRLRDSGYRASSAAVSSGGTTSYKVRVGPVIERSDAVALAEEIRASLGIEGLVMSAE